MLIGVESELKRLKIELKDNEPKEDLLPQKGNIAVIDGLLNFNKTDGYIQFMKLVLDEALKTYGKQNKEWQNVIDEIYKTAEKLQDANMRFTGSTPEDFKKYCKKISHLITDDIKTHLDVIPLDVMATDDPIAFLEKHANKGNTQAFLFYEEYENPKTWLMDNLMKSLSEIKIEKTARQHDISWFLTGYKYHEHVHDALNIIIQTAVYAINCSSTRKHDCYDFDVQKVNSDLQCAKSIIERTEHLV